MSKKKENVRVTIDLTKDEFTELHDVVTKRGCHKSYYIRKAIKEKIARDHEYVRSMVGGQ